MSWTTHIQRHARVVSTQEEAASLARAGAPEGTTVVADAQTGGRGRHGRSWVSAPGAGLWMTTLLRPPAQPKPPADVPTLSLVAGIACWKAVRSLGVEAARIKWPNDLVVGDRKLGGILLEASFVSGAAEVLVGIGLNVAATPPPSLPAELLPSYASVAELAAPGSQPGELRETLLGQVLRELEACYHRWQFEGLAEVLTLWSEADALAGEAVRVDVGTATIEGIAVGLSEDGALRVQASGGLTLVTAGEVLRVRPAGG